MKYLEFNLTLTFTWIVLFNTCSTPQIPKVFGHRGAMGHITENTLPSIAKAIDLGVDGVEIDVFRCSTGELVVFNDKTLEKLIKYLIIALTISTILSFIFAGLNFSKPVDVKQVFPSDSNGVIFLIAFMGWMPAPLDVSIWNSLWTIEKRKQQKNYSV